MNTGKMELNLNEMEQTAGAGWTLDDENTINHTPEFTVAVKYYGNEILRAGAKVYMYGQTVKDAVWKKITGWFN